MREELVTIVYRKDFVRSNERKKIKKDWHAIYERNRRKATAPDHCWSCRFFTDCSMSNSRNCKKWSNEK